MYVVPSDIIANAVTTLNDNVDDIQTHSPTGSCAAPADVTNSK